MTIGAHISADKLHRSFLLESIQILAVKFPQDHFIIFSAIKHPNLTENCTQVPILPKPKNNLLLYYWYTYKLPYLLNKFGADAFISDAGMLPQKTLLPRYLFFGDDDVEKRNNRFFKKVFLNSVQSADRIFTTENFIKKLVTDKYGTIREKITDVKHGLNLPVKPSNDTEGEIIKNRFTAGLDYFLYYVTPEAAPYITRVLKAFSQLKKRQKSSLKIILLLRTNIKTKDLNTDFNNYKYRDDVLLVEEKDNDAGLLIHHAYALIWLCRYTDSNIVFTAMQASVPVIAEENHTNKILFGNAVLFTQTTEKSLSDNIQLLYKDEYRRNIITASAKEFIGQYNAESAALALRNAITGEKQITFT